MFERPAILIQSVPLVRSPYRPPPLSPVSLRGPRPLQFGQLGQLVSVNPNVNVSIQTGIEQYLFPAGLLAGGAGMFVLGTAIPKDVRPWTTIAGLALLGAGVGVLVYRGLKKGGGAPAPAAPATPSGGISTTTPGGPPSFVPPSMDNFRTLQMEVVSPAPDQTIQSSGGFLFFGSKSIPVVLRLYNPASEEVTFNLDFAWDEFPGFTGYNRDIGRGTTSFQVKLGPGEEKNQTFDLPIQTTQSWTQMQVALAIYKKRTPVEVQQLLSNITFTVV